MSRCSPFDTLAGDGPELGAEMRRNEGRLLLSADFTGYTRTSPLGPLQRPTLTTQTLMTSKGSTLIGANSHAE